MTGPQNEYSKCESRVENTKFSHKIMPLYNESAQILQLPVGFDETHLASVEGTTVVGLECISTVRNRKIRFGRAHKSWQHMPKLN